MRGNLVTVTLRSIIVCTSVLALTGCWKEVRSEASKEVTVADAKGAESALRALDDSAKIQAIQVISPHLLELSTSDGVAYVTRDFKHMIVGNVLDVADGNNITELRMAELQRVKWDSLPIDLTLKSGNGSRRIMVVEDPNCGYCKQLHVTLAQIPDLTVYSLVAPILGPQSQALSAQVMCSPNPAQAWSDLMAKGVRPASDICDAGIQRVGAAHASAQRLKVQSTPVIFFEDGSRVSGAVSADDIERALQRAKPSVKS